MRTLPTLLKMASSSRESTLLLKPEICKLFPGLAPPSTLLNKLFELIGRLKR